jgi:hypothetical protein
MILALFLPEDLHMRRRLRLILLIGLGYIPAALPAHAQQKVGYVLDVRGVWTLRGDSHALEKAKTLPASSLLQNARPHDEDYVVVADLQGNIIQTIRCHGGVCRECHESGDCYDPIQPLPGPSKQPGAGSALLEAVMELFSEKPDRYSIHRVRGEDSGPLNDGVLPRSDSTVDLASVMAGRPDGVYQVTFAAVRQKRADAIGWESKPVTLIWRSGARADVEVTDIKPALYVLTIEHNDEQQACWTLLADSASYPKVSKSFADFSKEIAEKWGSKVNDNIKAAYERAYLQYLSGTPNGETE